MKKMLMFAAFAAVVGLCISATATPIPKWIQPVDTTTSMFSWMSETWQTPTPVDARVADDWKCVDGSPITTIKWWGQYHPYLDSQTGPVVAPTVNPPTSFILRQYENDATTDPANPQPKGTPIAEVEIPIANVTQTYVTSVAWQPGPPVVYVHIFSYETTLSTPWAQTKDNIYWLSVQAKFAYEPVWAEGFLHWEWMSTPPGDFLGRGLSSGDGGSTWTPVEIVPGEKVNFAFGIASASPVDLIPNKTTFKTTGQIGVNANVAVISTPCYPFVRITQPNGQTIYFVDGGKIYPTVTPFLGVRAGPVTVQTPMTNLPLLALPFKDLPTGTYILQGGAVDATLTSSVDDLKYVGSVDTEMLLIEQ